MPEPAPVVVAPPEPAVPLLPGQRRPRVPMDRALVALWKRFKADFNQTDRNLLTVHYLHLVKFNAERIKQRLPDEVELDDLISAGTFGLIESLKNFDMSRDVKFETFCAPRVRGAILDELRAMDWVPRLVRSRASAINNATRELESELGRAPTHEELRAKLKMPLAEFEKVLADATAVGTVSLSRKWFETDANKDITEIDVLEDAKGRDPQEAAERRDILQNMLLKGYARAERLIIVLYYFEGMTMKDIGATLDLSESRVSQMHSSIILRLRSQFSGQEQRLVSLLAPPKGPRRYPA